jgi:hypothetical protein
VTGHPGRQRGQPTGELGGAQAGAGGNDDDELIAAVASGDIAGPHLLAAGPGQVDQDPVANGMTVNVVDLLEVVDVDHQRDQGLAEALRVREGTLRHLHEMTPVVQAGHPVDRREFLVPDRQSAVVAQGGILAHADQDRQHQGTQHDAAERESKLTSCRPTTMSSR